MDKKPDTLWYFAYGSNMSAEKFTGSRGIIPLDTAVVQISGWTLVMEIPGMPYSEPSFGSIAKRGPITAEEGHSPDVIGVAYMITQQQYVAVIASEGGGVAYADIELSAEVVDRPTRSRLGTHLSVRTLASAIVRRPPPLPSQRYMTIVTDGARESNLPRGYQNYLSQVPIYRMPTSRRTKLGSYIFLAIWSPVFSKMESITKNNIGKDGNTSQWVVMVVRLVMLIMWAVHDFIFAPLFGRGDGLDETEKFGLTEVSLPEIPT